MILGHVSDFDAPPYERRSLDVSLTCVAPDETTAARLAQEAQQHQANYKELMRKITAGEQITGPIGPPPWRTPDMPMWMTATSMHFLADYYEVAGNTIRFDHIYFEYLGTSIVIFANWLAREGCSQIRLNVTERAAK